MPWQGTSVQATLDVFSSELIIDRSNGQSRRIALFPARTVAAIYAELLTALDVLDISCEFNPVPQEVADTTPFNEDYRPAAYAPNDVQRWFVLATTVGNVFDEWRSFFFGRSGNQIWWGAFDSSLMLFNGKHAPAPTDMGYFRKYDFDAELMAVCLMYGDETNPPFFFAYLYPEPPDAATLPVSSAASWSTTDKRWVLPYDAVRNAADPKAVLCEFLDSVYSLCVDTAGWDRQGLSYEAPKR